MNMMSFYGKDTGQAVQDHGEEGIAQPGARWICTEKVTNGLWLDDFQKWEGR